MPAFAPARYRFWRFVRKSDGCWDWTGGTNNWGYGRFNTGVDGGRRVVLAHRFAYALLVGEIPDGFVLDHLCGNRRCVRPDHLDLVTLNENSRRAGGTTQSRRRRYQSLSTTEVELPLQLFEVV